MLDSMKTGNGIQEVGTPNSLVDSFNKYFEVVSADTPEKLRESYRLRYEVYFKEGIFPGMNVDDCPEELEYDQYDERSAHSLLIHKPSGAIAGTVRLIPINRQNPNEKLPLEAIAGNLFLQDAIPSNIPRLHLGEISRVLLTPRFRARKGEKNQPFSIPDNPDFSSKSNKQNQSNDSWESSNHRWNTNRRSFSHAILGLFLAITRMSIEKNLTFVYCNMDPVWARLLRSFGIHFKPITPVIDYHGPRQGYFGCIPDILENVYQTNSQIWMLLTDKGAFFPLGKRLPQTPSQVEEAEFSNSLFCKAPPIFGENNWGGSVNGYPTYSF